MQTVAELRALLRNRLLPGNGILDLLIRALLIGLKLLATAQYVVRAVIAIVLVKLAELIDERANRLERHLQRTVTGSAQVLEQRVVLRHRAILAQGDRPADETCRTITAPCAGWSARWSHRLRCRVVDNLT